MTFEKSEQQEKENEFPSSDTFLYEPTGSATHVSLDCKTDYQQTVLTEDDSSGGTGRNPLAE